MNRTGILHKFATFVRYNWNQSNAKGLDTMFERILIANMLLPGAMLLLWIVATGAVIRLPLFKDDKERKRRSNAAYALALIAFLIGGVWLAGILYMLIRHGWLFAEGMAKAMVPIYLLGHFPVALLTLRRLRIVRVREHTQSFQTALSHPRTIMPMYAAAAASAILLYQSLFEQPIMPNGNDLALPLAVFLLLLLPPYLFVRRRYMQVRQGKEYRLGFNAGQRLLTGLLVIGLSAGNLAIGVSGSRLPAVDDMRNHPMDVGGGSPPMHARHEEGHHAASDGDRVEVKHLTGDLSAPATKKFTLTAQKQRIVLGSGARVEAWTFQGEVAPELRVKQGDMVEITLANKDIDRGVTIHWHGYNVPNAMDGVPGVTMNAVRPGESFTYKFRADQTGTYWFHSHQLSAEQVRRGLFGVLIVEPIVEPHPYDEEMVMINHRWRTESGYLMAFGKDDRERSVRLEAGQAMRLRVINTDNASRKYKLQGADYRITAIDGVPIRDPGLLSEDTAFRVPAGGRYDITFVMPERPVRFKIHNYQSDANTPGVAFRSADDQKLPAFEEEKGLFDPKHYGRGVSNELTEANRFDREFVMVFGNEMSFYNGKPAFLWTINGNVYPKIPTFVVKTGDRVKTTFVNRSFAEHPMHLHGHHMTVLKRNGRPVETPWLTDTLNVASGESYEVAFAADNPGIWMDHCHNLEHASVGMILHFMYDHVSPSYEMGARSGNLPDGG